jgi:hypothetical protein
MAYELNSRWMPVATRAFLVQEIGKAGWLVDAEQEPSVQGMV